MMNHLELFHRQMCTESAKVRRFIDTNKLKAQIKFHDTDSQDWARKSLKDISGAEKTPVLSVDGEPIAGAAAITTWLQDNLVAKTAV